MKINRIAIIAIIMIAINVFAAIIEKDTIIVSNGNNTITLSTNGIISLNGTNINTVITNNVFTPLRSTATGNEGSNLIGTKGGETLSKLLVGTALRGPARDCPIFTYSLTPKTNLTVSWTEGDIYSPATGYYKVIPGSKVLNGDNQTDYAYWNISDPNDIQWTTGSRPNVSNSIVLAAFTVAFGQIIQANISLPIGELPIYKNDAAHNLSPVLISQGLNVTVTGTALTNLLLSGGTIYFDQETPATYNGVDMNKVNSINIYCHTSGVWTIINTNRFPIGFWDNGSNIVACASTNWYRGLFVVTPNNSALEYILPNNNTYTSSVLAIAGSDPFLPPAFSPYIPPSTAYIFYGSDVVLRTSSSYLVDRRPTMGGNGSSSSSGGTGGGTIIPTLQQVLLAGNNTFGGVIKGLGLPSDSDQAASKEYVDLGNTKNNTGSAWVDPVLGNDLTAQVGNPSLPYQTIQSAVYACSGVADPDNRFIINASIGVYNENIHMRQYVSVKGNDIESTIINGQVTWGTDYIDISGSELQMITIQNTDGPCAIINCGIDEAYVGLRSCALYSTYENATSIMPVIQISRGNAEIYGTTWLELDLYPTNTISPNNVGCIYYLTTDSINNIGTYVINEFSGSHLIRCTDSATQLSVDHCDSTQSGYMGNHDGSTLMYLTSLYGNTNKIKIVCNMMSNARTYMTSDTADIRLNAVNNVDVIMAYSSNSVGLNANSSGTYFNNGRIIVPNLQTNHAWIGAACMINDRAEVFNSQLAASTITYPKIYTNDGTGGIVAYTINHAGGDILLGGGIDIASSGTANIIPQGGHLKILNSVNQGLEELYFEDSLGATYRLARDNLFNAYNTEVDTLVQGELVYMAVVNSSSLSSVKRASAKSLSTLPCEGIVVQPGGILPGMTGRVLKMGRTEFAPFNTSMWSNGTPLYVGITAGTITNVEPKYPYYSQLIGFCRRSGTTNGNITIHPYKVDTLGNQPPAYYDISYRTRFKANIGTTNISIDSGLISYTNSIFTSGNSIYTNSLSQWWPKATSGVVRVEGGLKVTGITASQTIEVDVYKNGLYYASPMVYGAGSGTPATTIGYTWSFVDTVTPTVNDYYQFYAVMSGPLITLGAGTNNWVYGIVE